MFCQFSLPFVNHCLHSHSAQSAWWIVNQTRQSEGQKNGLLSLCVGTGSKIQDRRNRQEVASETQLTVHRCVWLQIVVGDVEPFS